MNENFISKLETNKYMIGSFDVYQDLSRDVIKNNSRISEEEVDAILKSMPTTYRASIINKETNQYIGYIGLYNVDAKNNTASMRFEVMEDIIESDKNEIMDEFKKFMNESLNIQKIDEFLFTTKKNIEFEKEEIVPSSNIIIPSKLLEPGISEETMELFTKDYDIPKLQMPFTIKSSGKIIGIIGLTNLIWSNKRASLNLFLDKNLGSDITKELSGYLIDDYINYVHNSNIHNLNMAINGSNEEMLNLIKTTSMNYYGAIPYGYNTGEKVESNMMFQHLPNMKKENGIIIPDNKSISLSELDTEKTEMSEIVDLENGYKLVSPKAFEKMDIDSSKVLDGHISAIQERQGFAIPLGEDKYILQKGNGNYGLSKALMNYDYIILNDKNDYSGYINVLRNNANKKNAEIEIGIDPKLQHNGLGKIVINKFYDELFSIGYASITSAVFSFNNPSLRLHDKVAQLNGIRLESYYINGKLFDMNFYSKINEVIQEESNGKHI